MQNRAFHAQTEAAAKRKLEAVLRKRTGNHLTAWQRRLIIQAAGSRRQYSIQLYRDPAPLLSAAKAGGSTSPVRRIFGDVARRTDRPAAFLIQRFAQREHINTVFIYLPAGKGEYRHEA